MAKRTISIEVELPDEIDEAILTEIEKWIGNDAWMATWPCTDSEHPNHALVWDEFRAATGMNLQVSPTELKIRVTDSDGRCGGP